MNKDSAAVHAQGVAVSPASADLRVRTYGIEAWPDIAPIWSELAQTTPCASFFLTREWTETWLEVFGRELATSVLVVEEGKQPVAVCLLVKSRRWAGVLPMDRVSLNATGEPAADSTYIEWNNLLCRPGYEEAAVQRVAAHLRDEEWDEFALNGFTPGAAYEAFKRALADCRIEERLAPSYHVDLAELRRTGRPWESTLGHSSKKHLRQNLRRVSQFGALRLEAASDTDDALDKFTELAELGRKRWTGRSSYVVFSSPRFRAFHRNLIRRCVDRGLVQLLRLTAGERTVGLVYHLVYGNKVYLYQTGYDYALDRRISPGVVTLSQVLGWCLERGYEDYDFLAGESQHKRSFATGARAMVWTVFRRPGVKARIFDLARRSHSSFSRLAQRFRPRTQTAGSDHHE